MGNYVLYRVKLYYKYKSKIIVIIRVKLYYNYNIIIV